MHLPQIDIGGISFQLELWQAGVVIFLLFLLVLLAAQMRRHYLRWSFKGAWFGIFIGFILALVLEGVLLLSGRTFLTTVLGWKNTSSPLVNVLTTGNDQLKEVIGASSCPCPSK